MLYEGKEYVVGSIYQSRTEENVWSLHWKCRKCERTVVKTTRHGNLDNSEDVNIASVWF